MRRLFSIRTPLFAMICTAGAVCAATPVGIAASGASPVVPGLAYAPMTETASVAAAPNPSVCEGVTLHFIGLAGEDGKQISQAFQTKYHMKIVENNEADWGDSISAIKIGQPYDLMTVPMWYAQRMIAAGVVHPLDTSALSNWSNLFPGVAQNSLIHANGKTYGAPIAWGDGPYVYNPKLVPASTLPKNILGLLTPTWDKRYVMINSDAVLSLIAVADGYNADSGTLLTKAQFNRVEQQGKTLVDHAEAFTTSYQDGTDRLVSGDAALDISGWEAMLNFAKAKGATLKYGFFGDYLGGWFDSLGIPVTATHPACSLAYINYLLTPKVEASLATYLVSGTTNRLGVPYVAKSDQIYDYSKVSHQVTPQQDITTFPDPEPPDSVPSGYASLQQWSNAWQAITAGL
jgi:spermidine/putrescine transport system substrate-binding protein